MLIAIALLLATTTTGRAAAPEPAFLVKSTFGFGGGTPQGLTAVGNTLYFYINHSPWQSDGTTNGTVPVTIPGITDLLFNVSIPYPLGGNLIFFGLLGGITDSMIAYNPTTNTVTPLKSNFVLLEAFSGSAIGQTSTELFFMVGGATSEVWKTDGTPAGTVKVATVNATSGFLMPSGSATIGNTVFFVADDGIHGYNLWKTDGTSVGTTLVKDIAPIGDPTAFPTNLRPVGNKLFFTAGDGIHGRELWVSDGTTDGTTLVKDVTPGSASTFDSNDYTRQFTTAGGSVYFFTTTGPGSYKDLWKSDGTPAGTTLVKQMTLMTNGGSPNLTGAGSYVFFVNSDAQTGIEPWVSDGTANGTHILKEIIPGVAGSEPLELTAIDKTLVFAASSTNLGKEVWSSRGADVNTGLVADVAVGNNSSNPQSFTAAGDLVFFTADTSGSGFGSRQLWAMPRSLFLPYAAALPFVVVP
jgi:ELWxxDGT repeat protein